MKSSGNANTDGDLSDESRTNKGQRVHLQSRWNWPPHIDETNWETDGKSSWQWESICVSWCCLPLRDNCNLVVEAGAVPRIYPRQGVTLKMRRSSTWTDMLLSFYPWSVGWLKEHTNKMRVYWLWMCWIHELCPKAVPSGFKYRVYYPISFLFILQLTICHYLSRNSSPL